MGDALLQPQLGRGRRSRLQCVPSAAHGVCAVLTATASHLRRAGAVTVLLRGVYYIGSDCCCSNDCVRHTCKGTRLVLSGLEFTEITATKNHHGRMVRG